MKEPFILGIALILFILLLVMLAEKLRIAYPIVLVLGGLAVSLLSSKTLIAIDPELIFIIFLPPLLYEAAWYTSWKEFWRWRRIISSFAFLIVIATSLVVAVVSSALIPGFTLALGFLLGGIVSPPDAVSATSVLKYVRVPKSLSAIIEGESLLNDASSLIVFRFALIAVDTGHFIFHEAALSFFVVILMGIAVGLAIGGLYYAAHRLLPTNSNIDIVLTFTAPYVMYIAAEHFHFSGVLAVVSGGLFLSARSHVIFSHRSRLHAITVWSTIGFVLNGLIFMLIGLELPVIVDQLGTASLSEAIRYGVIITLVLVVSRIVCALGASVFTSWISRYISTASSRPGWRAPLVFGWAGMRGVVSLAAALAIPLSLSNGAAFPQRNLIIFITFMVILLTLVVQGLTLPLLIRWLKLKEYDKGPTAHEQELEIRKALAEHSMKYLETHHADMLQSNVPLQQLHDRLERDHAWPGIGKEMEREEFRRVYLQLIAQQRSFLHELNKQPHTEDEIIRRYTSILDLEEERLRMKFND